MTTTDLKQNIELRSKIDLRVKNQDHINIQDLDCITYKTKGRRTYSGFKDPRCKFKDIEDLDGT